jgi:hypothetical protein
MSDQWCIVVLVDRADEQLRSLNRVEICRLNTRSLPAYQLPTGEKMPQYEINFTAYVSDSIVIDYDGDIEDIGTTDIDWDGLPLINGATYDWNFVEIDSVEKLEQE